MLRDVEVALVIPSLKGFLTLRRSIKATISYAQPIRQSRACAPEIWHPTLSHAATLCAIELGSGFAYIDSANHALLLLNSYECHMPNPNLCALFKYPSLHLFTASPLRHRTDELSTFSNLSSLSDRLQHCLTSTLVTSISSCLTSFRGLQRQLSTTERKFKTNAYITLHK
jgi:hypothetical protein